MSHDYIWYFTQKNQHINNIYVSCEYNDNMCAYHYSLKILESKANMLNVRMEIEIGGKINTK